MTVHFPYKTYDSAFSLQNIRLKAVLLDRLALVAQRPTVVKLSRGRSVGRSVCPVHCEKNGGSDPDAVWHHKSDGSRDEADSAV